MKYDLRKYLNDFAQTTSITDFLGYVSYNISELEGRISEFEKVIVIEDGTINELNIKNLKTQNIVCSYKITTNELECESLKTNYLNINSGTNKGFFKSYLLNSNLNNSFENVIGNKNVPENEDGKSSQNVFCGIQVQDIDLQCNLELYNDVYDIDISKSSTILLDYSKKIPEQECKFRLPKPVHPLGKIGQQLKLIILLPDVNIEPVKLINDMGSIRNLRNNQVIRINKNYQILEFIFLDGHNWILKV